MSKVQGGAALEPVSQATVTWTKREAGVQSSLIDNGHTARI